MSERPRAVLIIEHRARVELRSEAIDLLAVPRWEPWDEYTQRYPASTAWWLRLDGRTLTFGRSARLLPSPAIIARDSTVSRRHCRVLGTTDGYAVQDLGSCGGLGLNDTLQTNGGRAVSLVSGDYFFVGGYTDRRVVYFDEGGPAPPWAAALVASDPR